MALNKRLSTMVIPLTFMFALVQPFNPSHTGLTTTNIPHPWGVTQKSSYVQLASTESPGDDIDTQLLYNNQDDDDNDNDDDDVINLRAPLKYIGPYPCLAMRFPNLATAKQRANNLTGISLDFVLDTAANTNTLNEAVAQELKLPVVGKALPGVGSAGALSGGNTYMLGDANLEGLGPELANMTFITNLTASALPVASPAAAGLLSLAFLQTFPGGVEFIWGVRQKDTENPVPPSITFYGEMKDSFLEGRTKIDIERIPITQLPSIEIDLNGVRMPALLDTGSPITVLNAQAAKIADVETSSTTSFTEKKKKRNSLNPFAAVADRLEQAKAASRGDVLTIMGTDGRPVNLFKSTEPIKITSVGSSSGEQRIIDFGAANLFVGDLPGLAALNGLGVKSPPAVVLGMDVLRQRPSMLLRAQNNEVWFD